MSAVPWLVPKHTPLFRAGSDVRAVLLIVSGVVGLTVGWPTEPHVVAVRTPGWLLGASTALTGGIHSTTAVALSACEVRRLTVEGFLNLRLHDAAFGAHLQEMLACEVADQLEAAVAFASGDSRKRLEYLIRILFKAFGASRADGSVQLRLPLSVTELAAMVGTGREWTSRILRDLAGARTMVRYRGWFILPKDSPWLSNSRIGENSRRKA
jgi:CRP-like cAMP-binding protein